MITRLFAMICLVIVTAGELRGQTSAERSALNNLEKKRWDKVNSNLNKAIRKDSLSVAAHYISSLFFFSPENPAYQIDSGRVLSSVAPWLPAHKRSPGSATSSACQSRWRPLRVQIPIIRLLATHEDVHQKPDR
jgi:hypothetical protein